MSARVFNPLVMSEMRRMMGRSNDTSGVPAAVARVRRDLFGPVNHEDAQSFVDRELAEIRKRDSEKWGFDFGTETPLENSRFKWERLSPEENIPQAYALRRLPFLGQRTEAVGQRTSKDASTNTTSTTTTSQEERPLQRSAHKQSQITDFLKCRKRSLSAGDASVRKIGSMAGNKSSCKVGSNATTAPPLPLSGPSKRKRSKTRQ